MVLVGKGVTYDTGGADLKTDGSMAGMSRDKGGAAAVAGVVRAAAALALPGVEVIGLLGLVRNSVGEESYVSDEIITSRAGVRVASATPTPRAASCSRICSAARRRSRPARGRPSSCRSPRSPATCTAPWPVYRQHWQPRCA